MNYHILNDSIVLNYDGKTISISHGDERYKKVIECIKTDKLDDIPTIVDYEKYFEEQGLTLVDGLLHVEGIAMPHQLSKRILEFKEKEIPYKYLLKFWSNLKLNPSFNARQMLFDFLEHNGHPLTTDGCFIAYRGVTEDFKDQHSGKFDNSPGNTCEMRRELVDDNPNNTCSSGLHVACYDYASGFGSKKIEVKVHPKDVVCVPADYSGTKMRVCKFTVVQECEGMREEAIYEKDDDHWSEGTCYDCGEEIIDGTCDCGRVA